MKIGVGTKTLQSGVILAILFLCQLSAFAADITFNHDGIIQAGDSWESVYVYDSPPSHTTVNMTGGAVTNHLYIYNASTFNMFAGQMLNLGINDQSVVNISGGLVGNLGISNSSQLTISGGSVTGVVQYANNSSQLIMSGGSVGQLLTGGKLTMSGGSVNGFLQVSNGGKVNISDGFVKELNTYGNSQTTISGGSMEQLFNNNSSQIIIDGFNFAINGSPVGYETITSSVSPYWATLTGTLLNGDIINTQFLVKDSASIILVPEPTTFVLLGLSGLFLHRYRNKKNYSQK